MTSLTCPRWHTNHLHHFHSTTVYTHWGVDCYYPVQAGIVIVFWCHAQGHGAFFFFLCTHIHNTNCYRDQTVDLQGYMTVYICTGPRCCPLQIYSETHDRGWSRWQEGLWRRPKKEKHTARRPFTLSFHTFMSNACSNKCTDLHIGDIQ